MTEIGNFYVDEDIEIQERCFSWCAMHSCLFVDQPVEAGFSYQTDKSTGEPVTDMKSLDLTDTSPEAMKQIHGVLDQFLTLFDELRPSPLIVTGESYGGLYTPNLAVRLANDPNVNLGGLAVGDPCIDWSVQIPTYADTFYGLGVVTKGEREQIRQVMQKSSEALTKYATGQGTCKAAFDPWNSVWDDDGHDSGGKTAGLFTSLTGSTMTEDILMTKSPISFGFHEQWFEKPDVKKAFHIEHISKPTDPNLALTVYDAFVTSGDWCDPSAPLYATLVDAGKIDVMIYTSNVDPLLGPPTTEAGIERILELASDETLSKTFESTKKTLWSAGNDTATAGYAKCIETGPETRLCYVIVRNAGHMTPAFSPRASLDMFNRFILREPFKGADATKEALSRLPTCAPCGGAGPFAGSNVPACKK